MAGPGWRLVVTITLAAASADWGCQPGLPTICDRDGALVRSPSAATGSMWLRSCNSSKSWQDRKSWQLAVPCPYFGGSVYSFPPATPLRGPCAVVGSSGRLLTELKGEHIDRHTVVIRLNENPTDSQYAAAVGKRTTMRVGTVTNAKNHPALLHPNGYTALRYTWPWLSAEVKQQALCEGRDQQCGHLSQDFVLFAASVLARRPQDQTVLGNKLRIDKGGRWLHLKPSTGFMAVLTALQHCSCVTLYGFGLCSAEEARGAPSQTRICPGLHQVEEDPKFFCKYYPYGTAWSKNTCSKFDHVFALEHETYKQWADMGLVRFG